MKIKILQKIKLFFSLLFRGMRNADELFTTSHNDSDAGNIPIEEKVEEDNLYAALLRGEVTQEVKDLRYEMYESVRRSEEFKAMGFSGKAVKKNTMFNPPENIDTTDGLKVILVQDNFPAIKASIESMKNLAEAIEDKHELDIDHHFKITHEAPFVSLKTERLARRVVVKKSPDSDDFILEFYFSEFPIENEPRAIYASKELKSLFETGSRTSDLTDIRSLTFQTYKAYGDKDWMVYDFKVKKYMGIRKYDGCYIMSFSASLPSTTDVVADYYDEVSVEKFEKKTPRKKTKSISLNAAKEIMEEQEEKIDETKASELAKKMIKKKNKR